MRGADLIHAGIDGLESLQTPYGFNASDVETGHYAALYGRDSLWVVLLLCESAELSSDPRLRALLEVSAPRVLAALAELQGSTTDDSVEEQPGRIPHEYHRVPSPHATAMGLPLAGGRSYGGFDETFLFVLAYDAFVRAFPAHSIAEQLWPHVRRALRWIDDYADPDGDGLYEYARRHPENLLNQVWKDSWDAATHTGFDVPAQPLAWLEVQAYGYAVLSSATASRDRALAGASDDCAERARVLAEKTDERYWLGPEHGYAMALDGRKQPVRMVASNPGHALWARIVKSERADPLIARMLKPDLMTPYGLRTLSRDSPFYAPFAYHRGAVWPFDNAVFALGLAKYGRERDALRVADALTEAMSQLGSPIESYAVLDAKDFVSPDITGPQLCWRHWPPQNRVQAFSAAALVVFGVLQSVMT